MARIEYNLEDYCIVVTVEHRHAGAITQEEAEIVLTKEWPLLFTQRVRYGG